MKTYKTPDNVLQLLNQVVDSASRAPFYASDLSGLPELKSLSDITRITATPIDRYRRQRLGDLLADSTSVQWIAGPYKGQSPRSVAVAEGPDQSALRFDLVTDAVKDCLSSVDNRVAVVVTSAEKRYFASEIAATLIHAGIPTHVFTQTPVERAYERVRLIAPDLLVVLSDEIDESRLPASVELCVTFRQSFRFTRFQQLDLYYIDEAGLLAQSTDGVTYTLNCDSYYFESSDTGNLIVTALYNRVQPVIRLMSNDRVRFVDGQRVQLVKLSEHG